MDAHSIFIPSSFSPAAVSFLLLLYNHLQAGHLEEVSLFFFPNRMLFFLPVKKKMPSKQKKESFLSHLVT